MKYCKKCGAELLEGVSFCEKCGNPIQGTAKKSPKKKIIVGGCVGVIILAIAVTGVLFTKGIIGGADKAVQTDADNFATTETPSATEEAKAIGDSEVESQESQKNDDSDKEDKAYEAYIAYKAYLRGQEDKEREDEEYLEDYDEQNQFSLIYLDADDYPELILYLSGATVDNHFLYTYKNGTVTDTEFIATDVLYKKRQGFIYDCRRHSVGNVCDSVDILKGNYTENVFDADYDAMIEPYDESDDYTDWEKYYWDQLYSTDEVADKCKITGGWDEPVYGANIDEAYTQLLSRKNK